MGTGFFKPSLRKQGFFLCADRQLLKIGVCGKWFFDVVRQWSGASIGMGGS